MNIGCFDIFGFRAAFVAVIAAIIVIGSMFIYVEFTLFKCCLSVETSEGLG